MALGREWAAITVATVAELPASRFTRSRAPRIELRRAGDAASWFAHLKRRQSNAARQLPQ